MKRILQWLLCLAVFASVILAVSGNPYAGNVLKFFSGFLAIVGITILVSPQGVEVKKTEPITRRIRLSMDLTSIALMIVFGWGWCAAGWILCLVGGCANKQKLKKAKDACDTVTRDQVREAIRSTFYTFEHTGHTWKEFEEEVMNSLPGHDVPASQAIALPVTIPRNTAEKALFVMAPRCSTEELQPIVKALSARIGGPEYEPIVARADHDDGRSTYYRGHSASRADYHPAPGERIVVS